jgi:hypothetical protein
MRSGAECSGEDFSHLAINLRWKQIKWSFFPTVDSESWNETFLGLRVYPTVTGRYIRPAGTRDEMSD